MKIAIKNENIFRSSNGKYRGKIRYIDDKGIPRIKEFSSKSKNTVKARMESFKQNLLERNSYIDNGVTASKYLGEVIEQWLKTFKFSFNKRRSNDTSESVINNHIIPDLGNIKILEIDSFMIQSLLNRKSETYSYSIVKKIYCELNNFYKHLYVEGKIKNNPMINVQIPKMNKTSNSKSKVFSDEELIKLKEVLNTKDNNGNPLFKDPELFILMLNTGLREGELLALQNKNIDLNNRRIKVVQAASEVKKRDKDNNFIGGIEVIITDPKSKTSKREIPLNNNAIEAIKSLQQKHNAPNDFIATDDNGNMLSPNALRKRFKRILNKAGIENKSIHSLRHTFATKAINGIFDNETKEYIYQPVKVISKILGHATTEITEKVYVDKNAGLNIQNFEKFNI